MTTLDKDTNHHRFLNRLEDGKLSTNGNLLPALSAALLQHITLSVLKFVVSYTIFDSQTKSSSL